MTQSDVNNDEQQHRYELSTPQGMAFAVYHRSGDSIVFTHTEVPEEMEGQGVGSRLVRAALDDARQQGMKVVPECPFVAGYIGQHREYLDLVDPVHRGALGV